MPTSLQPGWALITQFQFPEQSGTTTNYYLCHMNSKRFTQGVRGPDSSVVLTHWDNRYQTTNVSTAHAGQSASLSARLTQNFLLLSLSGAQGPRERWSHHHRESTAWLNSLPQGSTWWKEQYAGLIGPERERHNRPGHPRSPHPNVSDPMSRPWQERGEERGLL